MHHQLCSPFYLVSSKIILLHGLSPCIQLCYQHSKLEWQEELLGSYGSGLVEGAEDDHEGTAEMKHYGLTIAPILPCWFVLHADLPRAATNSSVFF